MCYNNFSMNRRYIRIYNNLDIDEIKEHLLIHGDLSAHCGHCHAMNLKLEQTQCPDCKTEFNYISFQNVKDHLAKMHHLHQQRPNILFIDYEDFKRIYAAIKAKEFLR